jgi:dTDP-4-amino-4,6-dideoxygalactose transaminase
MYCASDGGTLWGILSGALRNDDSLPNWAQLRRETVIRTHLGRTAIWQLCRIWGFKEGDEILIPAYNCGTEVDPFIKAGMKPVMYRVDSVARIDIDAIRRSVGPRTRAIYITHYFGWPQPIVELRNWCRGRGLRLIEDCALALFSFGPEGPLGMLGDATIFSIRKFLPVPDGGILTMAEPVAAPALAEPPRNKVRRELLPLLKNQILQFTEMVGIYGQLRRILLKHKQPERKVAEFCLPDIPADYYLQEKSRNWSMSRLSRRMLRRFDAARAVAIRRANYLRLSELLGGIPEIRLLYADLPEGTSPMVLPVLVARRSEFARRLNAHGIAAFAFWEGYHRGLDWRNFPEARHLKDNVLTLPIHQRLGPKHIEYIARILRQLVKELAQEETESLASPVLP